MSAVSRSRDCPLCQTADMSAVSDGRHANCDTQQTLLLCHTARHFCCVIQQDMSAESTDISAVSHSRYINSFSLLALSTVTLGFLLKFLS